MRQLTIISLYGQKTKHLEKLINSCVGFIHESTMRRIFTPYSMNQIHGTLIGMEKLIGFTEHFNANTWMETGNMEVMEFSSLLKIIKKHLPIKIRFGGFEKSFHHFYSFGKNPYERSFQVQWQKNKLTLIGWPHENGDFIAKRSLEALREDIFTHCNILHKYKYDNDLYMVIGEIKCLQSLTASELEEIKLSSAILEGNIRNYLANNITEVEITAEKVFLSRYIDEALPLDSTISHCITNPGIDADFISKLYT